MAESRDRADSGRGTDTPGLQEFPLSDSDYVIRAFILLLETVGGQIEYPFAKIGDREALKDRTIYVQYDDKNEMVRYTVKHHDVITGELVAPDTEDLTSSSDAV